MCIWFVHSDQRHRRKLSALTSLRIKRTNRNSKKPPSTSNGTPPKAWGAGPGAISCHWIVGCIKQRWWNYHNTGHRARGAPDQ
ncbi:hypothetical protein XENTR_v10007380 [Xenopus tropicalis]|nr:hypothetical protein XENTR_v10007380 [Xenopus tropicalis]